MNYSVHKKIVYFFSLLFLISSAVYSQDEDDNWVVGIGANIVDIRTPEEITGIIRDYGNASIEDLNMNGTFIRAFAGRYLKNGMSVQISGSANTIKKGFGYETGDPLIDDSFFAIDAKLKYDLNRLIGDSSWFDPFVLAGGGYSKIGDTNNFNIAAGWGFNLWFSRTVGVNFQSDYNYNPSSSFTDYFQHSVGLIFKLSRTPRFRWRGK